MKKGEKRGKNSLSLPSSPAVFVQLLSILNSHEYMKIIYVNCGVNNYMKEDHHIIYATFAVAKRKPEKNSGLYGIRTLNLCQLPLRYRWSALPILKANKPNGSSSLNWFVINPWSEDDDENYERIEIIYVNCGVNRWGRLSPLYTYLWVSWSLDRRRLLN